MRRIERDIEAASVPVGHRFAERQHALIRRILVVLRVFGGLAEAFDDRHGRRQVGVADAKIDDINAFGNRGLLHLIDGGEQIGGQCLDSCGNLDGETRHANRLLSSRMLKTTLFSPARPWQLLHPPALRLPRHPLCPGMRLSPGFVLASFRPSTLRSSWRSEALRLIRRQDPFGANGPHKVRCVPPGPSLAAVSLDGCFDHPAMKNGKSTAGMRRQSTLRRENVANEPIGDLMELR